MEKITIDYLNEALSYCPKTGILRWKVRPVHHFKSEAGMRATNSRFAGKPTGSPDTYGHLQVGVNGRLYLAHRLAWAIFYGAWPDDEIDHISGIKTDNRIDNLRVVSTRVNCKNKRICRKNESGVTGVYWYKSRNLWRAKITVDGKHKHIGYFSSIEDAKKARVEAQKNFGFHDNHGCGKNGDKYPRNSA
ncbi:HNH endonuclease [Klebsiella variicola]